MKEQYFADKNRYDCGMEYERCGRSGVLLPKVSLGFWHNFGSVDPYERSREITHYAFDHGITHFDLANNYGPVYGSAEETMGRLMDEDFRPYRDELFISTKAGYDMWPGPYGNWGSRKYLMASLDQSLRRMKIDYVDLFYSHRYDPDTPLEETLQALVDIVRQGKALYVGISNWPLEALKYGHKYLKDHDVPLLIYQGRLNMLSRTPQETGITDFCAEKGIGFIAFSPLAQGLLTDRYLQGIPADSRMAKEKFLKSSMLTPELLEKLRHYNDVAQSRGETLAEMALAWILHQRAVTSVLVGASSTPPPSTKCFNPPVESAVLGSGAKVQSPATLLWGLTPVGATLLQGLTPEFKKKRPGAIMPSASFLSLQKRNAPSIILRAHREVQPDGGTMLL